LQESEWKHNGLQPNAKTGAHHHGGRPEVEA
jgi:hypothetical protein